MESTRAHSLGLPDLEYLATSRTHSLFASDWERCFELIQAAYAGRRILVIGGAGSIGSATIRILANFNFAALHVVDHDENGLAELVRDLRSGTDDRSLSGFRTVPIDFGSPNMRRFLLEQKPYDLVLNFAALKHVRSEKDVCSLLQMLYTNVILNLRLLTWLGIKGGGERYFAVSTDKAAYPTSLLGASKRLMEHVIFSTGLKHQFQGRVSSARFANVAFSNGSLLHSWLQRLEKKQPLAVPDGTQRYFISSQEAGSICLIAPATALDGQILIPRMSPENDLRDLRSIAEGFLRFHGFEPHICLSESEARAACKGDWLHGRYPLLVTPLNTSGEKPYEEFIGPGESVMEIGLKSLLAIPHVGCDHLRLQGLLRELLVWIEQPEHPVTKEAIIDSISRCVPELNHVKGAQELDERM